MPRKWTREKIVTDIREISMDNIAPRISKVDKNLVYAAKRYFGSWDKACEAAGVQVHPSYACIFKKPKNISPYEQKKWNKVIACVRAAGEYVEHGL